MSNFACETCGVTQSDSPTGYVSGCHHYPPEHSRPLVLDFGEGDECEGFCRNGVFYRSETAAKQGRAVHPVRWRNAG